MVETGRIIALSTSDTKGTRKSNVPQIRLLENWGMEGDAHAGDWHRQISLLGMESIEKIHALGLTDVGPGDFAENITTASIDLLNLNIGDHLQMGECELEITQIGKECHARCAIYLQVGDCVMPREGLFARVIRGGLLRVGDPVCRTGIPQSAQA